MDYLSFKLPDDFVEGYAKRKVDWGFPIGGGNSLGELTYISKYSRKKADGSKERWHETCRRVVEGYFSILKDHCTHNRTPWNEYKAQVGAKDAFERMFVFKWLPPGRGLWMMGTEFVNGRGNSASLQSCAFLSTEKLSAHSVTEATKPFVRLMEMSMLGVGVGFDVLGAGNLVLHDPDTGEELFVVEDSREGWFESYSKLLESYFFKNRKTVVFDYSMVRPAGEPIKGFGGVASGPGPLIKLHEHVTRILGGREGDFINSTDIVDLMNAAGKCVVSGGVRRSAELALGSFDDEDFLDLKSFEKNPERMGIQTDDEGNIVTDTDGNWVFIKDGGWGFTSNNSIVADVGEMDYTKISERIVSNGEPGLFYLDLARKYGRLVDAPNDKDHRVMGTNPCAEQSLESDECCTLVETFITKHDSIEDFKKTLKQAYLYGKAVTLLPTHWPETNEVMQRNRRIGTSISGLAQFVETEGWVKLRSWLDEGYGYVAYRDRQYSEWLGVRESIKMTSVKPSGTVSIVVGATPGVHWPTASGGYIRRIRYSNNDPLVNYLVEAGYKYEIDVQEPETTVVFSFPTIGPDMRDERDVSIWEKAELAALLSQYWADNQVSVTVSFRTDEASQICSLLQAKEGQMKSVSFLPLGEKGAFAQMPYEAASQEVLDEMKVGVKKLNFKSMYSGKFLGDAEGEKFCNNDTCLI